MNARLGILPTLWAWAMSGGAYLLFSFRQVIAECGRLELEIQQREEPHTSKRTQRGSILLEAALTFPLLIFLCLGFADLILAESAKNNVNYLAQNAANCSLQPSCSPSAYVANAASGLSMNSANLSVTAGAGTATVSYTTTPIGPFFPSLNLSATASAVAP